MPKPRLDLSGEFFTRKATSLGDFADDTHVFRAVIATDTPVARTDRQGPYLEILDPAGVQFKASDDLPLLTDHRRSVANTVGRVSEFAVEGNTVTASLRLSLAYDVWPLVLRIMEGTLQHVSVAYKVLKWRDSRHPQTNARIKTAVRWLPVEVSLTPIPADPNSIILRSAQMDPELATTVEQIRSLCGLDEAWIESLPDDIDEAGARAAAVEAMRQRQAPRIRVTRQNDDPVQIRARKADALAYRMGAGDLPDASREYAEMSLMDMARESIAAEGVSVRTMSSDDILQRAAHGASDFPLLVSDAMNKVAATSYQAAESPLKKLARQRVLSNFKPSATIRLGELGRLEEMTEHGEFKHTSRAEAGETMSLKTFGHAINLSRKLIINDDLNMLGDTTAAMGAAAAQTEAEELVTLLTGNPKLSDGKAVFHADRQNLGGAGSALSESSLSAARLAMRTTRGLDGKTIINVKPRYLVVGPELETDAEKLLAAIYPAKTADANVFTSKLELVVEPRIEGEGWYLLADPATVPSIQYGYLAGAQGVQIRRQDAWNTLGLSYRAFLDFGTGWIDWRGAYHATGAA